MAIQWGPILIAEAILESRAALGHSGSDQYEHFFDTFDLPVIDDPCNVIFGEYKDHGMRDLRGFPTPADAELLDCAIQLAKLECEDEAVLELLAETIYSVMDSCDEAMQFRHKVIALGWKITPQMPADTRLRYHMGVLHRIVRHKFVLRFNEPRLRQDLKCSFLHRDDFEFWDALLYMQSWKSRRQVVSGIKALMQRCYERLDLMGKN